VIKRKVKSEKQNAEEADKNGTARTSIEPQKVAAGAAHRESLTG
jgi:hypothetical protein